MATALAPGCDASSSPHARRENGQVSHPPLLFSTTRAASRMRFPTNSNPSSLPLNSFTSAI
eukprot:CAMPEP_0171863056 /NCGR_PEP_ID=MMETSP0992-20121227/28039_1 /TAXON_ID=483369 /ORGANISM="non described non described, Strain CCMP2098" /LENGTH=60 /DNA_ID=CAMNT_0012485373 /DNA_START=104 /DNA_END=283 /DNA_ORIENTATION=+